MTTPDDLTALREKPFTEAVEKFEELLKQGGPAFLIGAGCSKCAGLPLTTELTAKALEDTTLDTTSKDILTALKNQFTGAASAHIEDFLSELIDLLAIAERRADRGATETGITLGTTSYTPAQLRVAAEGIKRAIATVIQQPVSIETHRAFAAAVHRPRRVGKAATGQVVDYLVLNYDTALEDALALERVPFSDGIDGGVTGWWDLRTFDRDGLAARVLKLHGSINWCELGDDPLPRRIAERLAVVGANERKILIWPASTKYRETQLDPYAQIMDLARRVMRPARGSQRVLIVCGYAFGDAHINVEMERALRESSGNLTVVAFTSENEPSGRLAEWVKNETIRDQVLIFANRGFFHGATSHKSDNDLLWWKFENVTRLIGGER